MKRASMWPLELMFVDLSVGLDKIKLYFGDDGNLRIHITAIETFFSSIVTTSLKEIWKKIKRK